jgi:hypothetical protein
MGGSRMDAISENAVLFRYYRQTIRTMEDLKRLVSHMVGFMEIAKENNREVIFEVWFRKEK